MLVQHGNKDKHFYKQSGHYKQCYKSPKRRLLIFSFRISEPAGLTLYCISIYNISCQILLYLINCNTIYIIAKLQTRVEIIKIRLKSVFRLNPGLKGNNVGLLPLWVYCLVFTIDYCIFLYYNSIMSFMLCCGFFANEINLSAAM